MLRRAIKQFVSPHIKQVNFFSTHHDEPTPTKLDKVDKLIVNLYIKNKYSVVEKVPAFVGQSILQAISRMKVQSFSRNICYGNDTTYRPHYRPHDNDGEGPNCAGCRIVFSDNWFKRIHNQTDGYNSQEEILLFGSTLDLKSNTRLACCVPVEAWMQGLTCYVDTDPSQSEGLLLI